MTEISATEQLRLLELRREISRFIARTGVERASAGEREGLREVAKEFLTAAKARDDLLKDKKTKRKAGDA